MKRILAVVLVAFVVRVGGTGRRVRGGPAVLREAVTKPPHRERRSLTKLPSKAGRRCDKLLPAI
jgi:hypothetical protein